MSDSPRLNHDRHGSEPTLTVTVVSEPAALVVRYRVDNRGPEPIAVFDVASGPTRTAIDPDWAHVTIEGDRAVVARSTFPLPDYLQVDVPLVPYARVVAPGGALSGVVRRPLPLEECGPYQAVIARGFEPVEVAVATVEVRIGYCPCPPSAPPGGRHTLLGGVALLALPYRYAEAHQRLLVAPPRAVAVRGVDARPRTAPSAPRGPSEP